MSDHSDTQQYHLEAEARLRAALRYCQDMLSVIPPRRDLHKGTELANAWALVTVSYSGIEQSLKLLLAQRDRLTVSAWRCSATGKRFRNSHGLRKLFDAVDEQARTTAAEYYKRFRSLHNYINSPSLEEYLTEASRGERGYGLWGYVLVEDSSELPGASFDAMLAVWASLLEVIECRNGRRRPVVMPDVRLSKAVLKACPAALREQMAQYDHPLNALADITWKNYRNVSMTGGEEDIRTWLSTASSNDRDLSFFVMRARGQAFSGIGVRWNKTNNRFETIPWNLPLIERVDKPKRLHTIECDVAAMRIALLKALHPSDFSVTERLLDIESVRGSHSPRWQCTLKAERHAGGRVSIEVWENAADFGQLLHVKTSKGFEEHVDAKHWKTVKLMGWTEASPDA